MRQLRKKSKKQSFVTAMIGNSTHIGRDYLSFTDTIYIEGQVDLDVIGSGKSRTEISISEEGEVGGNIRAVDVYIAGTVRGNVHASGYLHLAPTARIRGSVEYASLDIADGAVIEGIVRKLG